MTKSQTKEIAARIRALHLKRIISDAEYRAAIADLKAHR